MDTGDSLGSLLLCVALLAYAWGFCDGYESDEDEKETDATRSMFS